MNIDDRGSFKKLLKQKTVDNFLSILLSQGLLKGKHWHHSKWEFFIVVSGHGLIQERKIGR